MQKYKGELGLFLVSIIWGSGFIASAIGLDYLTPNQTLTGRFLVASVILILLNLKNLKEIKKKTLKKGVILGAVLYVSFILQTVGLQYTTPSKNAFLTAVNVAVVPFIGFLFYKKSLNKKDILRALLSIIGVGAISLEWSGLINLGDVLSFLCALTFAYHIYLTGEFTEDENPMVMTMIQMTTAFVLSLVVMVSQGESLMGHDVRGYAAVVYLGVFSTTIAFLVQTMSQKHTSSNRAAVIMSTESLFAMIFSIIVLKEHVLPRMIIGAIIIFTAIILPQGREEVASDETDMEIEEEELA